MSEATKSPHSAPIWQETIRVENENGATVEIGIALHRIQLDSFWDAKPAGCYMLHKVWRKHRSLNENWEGGVIFVLPDAPTYDDIAVCRKLVENFPSNDAHPNWLPRPVVNWGGENYTRML